LVLVEMVLQILLAMLVTQVVVVELQLLEQ
jgi:hypothetical protein